MVDPSVISEPMTLSQAFGLLVIALGGKEGVVHLYRKRNRNGPVNRDFCDERNGNIKDMLEKLQEDVSKLLERPHT